MPAGSPQVDAAQRVCRLVGQVCHIAGLADVACNALHGTHSEPIPASSGHSQAFSCSTLKYYALAANKHKPDAQQTWHCDDQQPGAEDVFACRFDSKRSMRCMQIRQHDRASLAAFCMLLCLAFGEGRGQAAALRLVAATRNLGSTDHAGNAGCTP